MRATVSLFDRLQLPDPPPWNWRTTLDLEAELTTDHARGSYGGPVLIYHDHAYGPGDIAVSPGRGHQIAARHDTPLALIEAAEAAGWRIKRYLAPSVAGPDYGE